ncbi:hypothetical protein DERF_014033 [Dermatophagoides farinae]|uniref:Uncharacterized protein n=1 Tax=Dermatophagoides farinae TaxID=6954 RepID=A0A922L0X3_DERFA|nr:hypothetical protein DERF_014033 [Dermatophagoides farinae]
MMKETIMMTLTSKSFIYVVVAVFQLIIVDVNCGSSMWSNDDEQPNISLLARGSQPARSANNFGQQDPRIWHSISPQYQLSSSSSTIPRMKQRILFEHQNNDDHDVAEIADSSIMNLAYLSRSKRSVPSSQLPPPPMMMLPPLPPPPPPLPFLPPPPPPPAPQSSPSAIMPYPWMMMMGNHHRQSSPQISDNVASESQQQQQQQQLPVVVAATNEMERRRYYRPPKYQQYPRAYNNYDDCQYHTIVNGDSEIVLRKLYQPNFNDPRYKVLLKGNQKSSFGSVRLQMVQ